MLTVFREMAHSIARQLARLDADRQRLDQGVSEEQQDAVLAEVLERAIEDGQRAVERTPEQLEVLRDSGVVDAGGYGLVLIMAGVVAGLRGDDAGVPEVDHQAAPRLSLPHHEDSRFRYCTELHRLRHRPGGPRAPAAARGPRRLGPRRRRRGDPQGPRPHRRARVRGRALRGRRGGHQPRRRRHARAGRRTARTAALGPQRRPRGGRRGRLRTALRRARRPRRAGRRDAQPLDLRAARRDPPGPGRGGPRPAQLLQRDHGRRARLRALREARARRPHRLPAGEPAGPGRARPGRAGVDENAERLDAALEGIASGGVAAAARDDAQGRFPQGRRGRLRRRRDRRLGRRRDDPGGDDRPRSPRAPRSSP